MRYNLSDLKTVRAILEKHGFSFSKSLGQNFLINPNVCPAMAEEAVASGEDGVLEVGPGIGVLTAELCARAKKVVAVELDRRLLPVLSETLGDFDNVEIVSGDVLKLDLHALLREKFAGCRKVTVCANLPYYITSPVIMKLLEEKLPVESIVVMVQKEAADRLCAEVGSRGSFVPSPKVDSAVIRLDIRKNAAFAPADETFFFRMVRAAFAQRRKTALNGISAGLALPKETVAAALQSAGLPADVRAEKLTMEQLCRLSDILLESNEE